MKILYCIVLIFVIIISTKNTENSPDVKIKSLGKGLNYLPTGGVDRIHTNNKKHNLNQK